MTHEIVQQFHKKQIFPKRIPEKRKNRDIKLKYLISVGFSAVASTLAKNKIHFLVYSTTVGYSLLSVLQILSRFCDLFEEYHHLTSRYEGNVWKMLKDTFTFNTFNCFAILLSFFTVSTMEKYVFDPDEVVSWGFVLLAAVNLATVFELVSVLLYWVFHNKNESPVNTAKTIGNSKGLDYGSGLAYSFFYGYLNLILPCTGDERKGLKEQIMDYESIHNVSFGSKKLHILIPLSCFCPTKLNEFSKCMDDAISLDWRRMDRAGVKERQYHNSVYKLWPEQLRKKPIYICAEYATPLLTLHEVMQQNTPETTLYKNHQKEIVTNFYLTLYNIIQNNRNCRDLVELIYYRDIDNEGNPMSLDQLDIGELLLERINK